MALEAIDGAAHLDEGVSQEWYRAGKKLARSLQRRSALVTQGEIVLIYVDLAIVRVVDGIFPHCGLKARRLPLEELSH